MGTSLASFRVGGGIVLLLMALAMLRAQADAVRTSSVEVVAAEEKQSVAVVPLTLPLLGGPGSISSVIIEMHRSTATFHPVMVIVCILLVSAVLWLVLRLAVPIENKLGPIGLNVVNRLFGLILAAISIEIMADGLRALFPMLDG
jgi:multiple antibiotic resistance protein